MVAEKIYVDCDEGEYDYNNEARAEEVRNGVNDEEIDLNNF